MRSRFVLRSAYGGARIDLSHPQLAVVEGDCDLATYHAQGYASARLRLWQLDLSRRLAAGRLGEVLGKGALATDRFQRRLNLGALAQRSIDDPDGAAERGYLQAYVDGINQAIAGMRLLPVEFLALGYRPQPFSLSDVYLVAHLKYFINSAWQFELYHALVTAEIGVRRAARLFASIDEAGVSYPPLPGALTVALADDLEVLLASAKDGLARLGLESPDVGSNVFAVRGCKTHSGYPLLANDPHMGLVNPGFNLIFHLRSGEGLDVFGSNFPGAPGVVVGRNRQIAWGMTGVMMDNQDLFWGEVDLAGRRVKTHVGWQALAHCESEIAVRKGRGGERHDAYGFGGGQMLMARDGVGLFLRWPALDRGLGSVSLCELNRARDWDEFRAGMARLQNSPGVAAYADQRDNIGTQVYGLLPARTAGRETAGSLVLPLDDARWAWQGYVPFDALPRQFNPQDDVVLYANQYSPEFAGEPYVSNRWHPPSRARRVRALLAAPRLDSAALAAIQDDRFDVSAEYWLPRLLPMLDAADQATSPLANWRGDTRDVASALLFERWVETLCIALLKDALPMPLASRYLDLWPGHRWNLLNILLEPDAGWPAQEAPEQRVREAYRMAIEAPAGVPVVDFRHTLRRHPLLRPLFAATLPYAGGSRETVSALRRNCDFLTAGQGAAGGSDYSFGTSFKLVFDLAPDADNLFLSNMPNKGNPFGFFLKRHLHRWRAGKRYVFRFPRPISP